MPPIMIATEKYKKLPAGREFPCSASSAKALSALGMANYKTANTPELMNREMSHIANIGEKLSGQAGSQSVSSLDLVSVTTEPDNSDAWEDGTLGQSEEHVKVSDLDQQAVNDILSQEATESSEESAISPTPVVGSVAASVAGLTVEHSNKVSKNTKPAKTSKK